jgi:hypothetical protein
LEQSGRQLPPGSRDTAMPMAVRRKAAATMVSSFRLPTKLVEQARKLARSRRWSLAEYVRWSIETAVAADEAKAERERGAKPPER